MGRGRANANRGGAPRHFVKFEDHYDEDGNVHTVQFFAKELDDATIMLLDDFIGDEVRFTDRYRPGMARVSVLAQAVESLKIDGKHYDLKNTRKPIPRYYNPDTEKSVMDVVLGYVIKYNPFFVEQDKYRDVFEKYALDDEEMIEQDPTPSPS